jgi:hypothetical protein
MQDVYEILMAADAAMRELERACAAAHVPISEEDYIDLLAKEEEMHKILVAESRSEFCD